MSEPNQAERDRLATVNPAAPPTLAEPGVQLAPERAEIFQHPAVSEPASADAAPAN